MRSLFVGKITFWLAVIVGGLVGGVAQAQESTGAYGVVYRPGPVEYRVLERDRFEMIYQTGASGMVRRTARALSATQARTDSVMGTTGEPLRMPVVINNFNDRSNGFVQAFPFRQEIETPSIKSDALVAKSSSWPALVAPHELVHAAHAEVDGTVGVGSLLRLFAPDMARGINLLGPPGLLEGVAVYRESHVEPGGGRLNEPLFAMKMKAAMVSDEPWGLTEMLEAPAYTQPSNRFYIGGAHAFEYLAERGDSVSTQFFRSTVRWHNRIPVLGQGAWLGVSTGSFPHALGDEIQAALGQRYRAALERRAPFTEPTLISGKTGLNYRRPYWLDEETLVAYAYGYDVRPGFYRINAETGARTPIRIQELTEDYAYGLSADTSALYAARYVSDPLVPRQAIGEVERVSLDEGTATRLTRKGRASAPAQGWDGTVYAVTNDGPFTRWSVVTDRESTRALTPSDERSVREIAPSPRDSTIALLVHDDGRQYVARAPDDAAPLATRRFDGGRRPSGASDTTAGRRNQRPSRSAGPSTGGSDRVRTAIRRSTPVLTPWIGLRDATIYDLSWGPDGRYLLFAADLGDTANVFAYDTDTKQVRQYTNVRFGALEPSLSPDRSTLAFVNYQHERHDLVRIPFRPDSATVVPDSLLRRPTTERLEGRSSSGMGASVEEKGAPSRSYRAWRHLAPRMLYPTLHGEGDGEPLSYLESPDPNGPLGVGVGVGVQGADPLQRWAYQGTAYWQDGRLWGEAQVKSGAFLLRPSVSMYDRAFTTLRRTPKDRAFKIEERGATLGVELPVTLTSNVYESRLRMGMDVDVRQTRFFGGASGTPSDYVTRTTLEPQVVFGYRLQQNTRDLVPNTGVVVGVAGEFDVWTEERGASRGAVASVDGYLPVLRAHNTGIRVGMRSLVQNERSIFSTSTFVPRGYTGLSAPASGPFLQFEAEITQPLWYIDDGFTVLPLYLKALSVYGFGETMGGVEQGMWRRELSSVGGGISLQCRVFYGFNLDLRVGAAYRPETGDVVTVYR